MLIRDIRLFIVCLPAFLAACAGGSAASDSSTVGTGDIGALGTADTRLPPDSLLRAFEGVVLRLGHSRDSIASVLGPASSVTASEAADMDGERDSLITVRYPHIAFFLHKPLSGTQEYFSDVIVEDSLFALPGRIAPKRTTRAQLTVLLGEPHRIIEFADSAAFTYDVPLGPVVQFYFVGDLLRKVRWVYQQG